ncbi:hypothetical protein [uncultured Stenotrophomonas sp.]|uniref:hypothetical protein n=1 Tax=uncultured Stenotrophomonas sp. TaxID=165438 RepID=UPI0025E139A6|nr:hypothetical protein [uncultured Stenotrophomonas sp.]
MLPIALMDPPRLSEFREEVEDPGNEFLLIKPAPKGKEWKGREYWRRALPMMREVYGDVCQYSCHFIPHDTGANSIEHFKPKDVYPAMAYSWSNFRIVCGRLNGRKGVKAVVDPFSIPSGLFEIEFPALLVKVSEDYDGPLLGLAEETIRVLGLNDESTCVKTRVLWYRNYINGDISFEVLKSMAPFLSFEMARQGLIV